MFLVERPGGVVAAPVVFISVGVGEEISTQGGVPFGLLPRRGVRLLPYRREVVTQCAKLGLMAE